MKYLVIVLVLYSWTELACAQCNVFYPIKEGVVLHYNHVDKNNKVQMRSTNTFKNISGSGANMKATMVQEMFNGKNGNSLGKSESEWVCENGVLYFTINSMSMVQPDQSAEMTVDITGDKMDIPSDLKVGQKLRDLDYNIKMSMSTLVIMNRNFKVTDRIVEKEETIVTPAGSFECVKITFNTVSDKGIGSGQIKTAFWYAKNTGLIQSEIYKEPGTLASRQVLTKIVN